MTFRPYSSARVAQILPGDTLETIAAREREGGNPISASDIAKFNWGTDDPEKIQELMRDELGAIERTEAHAFVLSPDTARRSELKIPEPFFTPGLPIDRTYRMHVRRKACPRQFIDCAGLPSASFDFDSSFVRPEAKAALVQAQQLAQVYPDAMFFAFGHTDAVGDDVYNKKLSERRAWAVYTFLTRDADAWETLYSHPDEDWGVGVLQVILQHLGHGPGEVDGDLGPATQTAMRAFLGWPEGAPVRNDAEFRRALFAAYMGGPDDAQVPAERWVGEGFMGCGEFNLAVPTDNANEDNRRVTIFAFHRDRLPNIPCAFADVAPCRARIDAQSPRYNPGFSCSFYDTVAEPCHSENEHHSVSLLIRKYPVDSKTVGYLMDEYRLRSRCGKLGAARKAMSAGTRDEEFVELRWPHLRAHMALTLTQRVGGGERVLLAEAPFATLREDGQIATDDGDAPEPVVLPDDAIEPDDVDPSEVQPPEAEWKSEY